MSRKGSGLNGLRSKKQLVEASCFCVAPPPQRPLASSTIPWLAENDSDWTTRHGWVTWQLHSKHVESSSDSLLSGATCVQVESQWGSSELRLRLTCVTQRCYTPAAAAVDVVLDLLPSSASAAFEVTADSLHSHCWVNVQPFLISWVTGVLFCCCCFQTNKETNKETKKQTKAAQVQTVQSSESDESAGSSFHFTLLFHSIIIHSITLFQICKFYKAS